MSEAPPHPRLSTVVEWYSSLPSPLLLLSAGILAALVWWGPWALVQAGFASQKMFSSLLAYFLAFYLLVAVPASYSIVRFTERHCSGGRCRPLSRILIPMTVIPIGYALTLYALQLWLSDHGSREKSEAEKYDASYAKALEQVKPLPVDVVVALLTFCLNCCFYPIVVYRQALLHLEAHYGIERAKCYALE